VAASGLIPFVPEGGMSVDPIGWFCVEIVRLPRAGFVPSKGAVKGEPTFATNVPVPVQNGGVTFTVSMMRSTAVELTFPLFVDSMTMWITYLWGTVASVMSHVTVHAPVSVG
jgi:hypothetical protein